MLSLGKLAPGQQGYYLDTVARGAEEYYTGAGEAPGRWVGAAAVRLGLEGEVDPQALHLVLEHRDPRTGEPLTRAQGAARVPGFDATFCAPKSVSLLFAMGDERVSREVREAHDLAVDRALGVLEGEAARARRGKGGVEQVAADGFVAAAFRHRTSRAGDPQLHTHVVVANLVHAPDDDRWSALDARPFYAWAKTVGYLYETELRTELTRRLGVAWTTTRNGIADVAGVPAEAIRAFSQRRQEIELHLERVGESTAHAAQIAAYATRRTKTTEPEWSITEWHERAARAGLDDQAITNVLGMGATVEPPTPGTDVADALFSALASPDGLTSSHSTFGRRDVIRALSERCPPGTTIGHVVALSEAFLASPHVIALGTGNGLTTSDVIRRSDGRIVATGTDQARWTTPELLAIEARLVESAGDRRNDNVAVADREQTSRAVRARPSLGPEQVQLVRRITSSGAGVDIVEGAAGTGKTYALDAARDAWEGCGHRVRGCALAARAAAGLERGSGIPSQTIHRFLRQLDNPRGDALRAGDVLIVDEAAMVGTRVLAQLLDHAEAARAKVVLVGDHHQLPAIDAGGAFAGLAQRLDATRLYDNRRQVEPWERRALARLRVGATQRAIAAYQEHGRIKVSPTPDLARERLVEDWLDARRAGHVVTMLAAHRSDVDELNRLARERLHATGLLPPDEAVIADRPFAVGDDVIATQNDYRLDVLNGTRGVITACDSLQQAMTIRTDDDRSVDLPAEYVVDGNLTHAYALTLHKAQGISVGEAFVLGTEGLDREHAYSAVSRGADGNWLYLSEETIRAEDGHAPEVEPDAIERLEAGLGRSTADGLAIDFAESIGLEL